MAKMSKQQSFSKIVRNLKISLPEIRKNYRVSHLSIFGSYIRKEAKKKSDLDLLVEFEEAPTLFQFVRLKNHLTKIVGVSVDLVMKKTLKPTIGRHILEEAIPL